MQEFNWNSLSNYTPPELVTLDAWALSASIRDRSITCQEVMAAYLDHVDVLNPLANAIVSLRDRETLMSEAAERDAQLERGEYFGWMHGFPQAIKDLTPVKGITTTFGSPLFKDYVPDTDAIIVERVKRDGAIIIGKTNTPEYGLGSQTYNPVFGPTRNAYDLKKTAGGSSGGAAAALALRMLPVADGSDMMGSLRNPAAYNNIIGFRPSVGRVPHYAGPSTDIFSQQLSTEGPMARTVGDLAGMIATQAGYDARVPSSIEQDPARFLEPLKRDFDGLRIGWLGDWNGYLPTEPGLMPLCERSLGVFGDMGCHVEPVTPVFDPARLWSAWVTLRHWVLAGGPLGRLYKDPEKRAQLKPEARWEVEGGLKTSVEDVSNASIVRSEWYQTLQSLFEEYEFLVLPTAQVFPFDVKTPWPKEINNVAMDTYHRWMEVVVPGSMSGCPVVNVPAGFNEAGLPMGLQIIGRNHADFDVLQFAHGYEQARGGALSGMLPPPLGLH